MSPEEIVIVVALFIMFGGMFAMWIVGTWEAEQAERKWREEHEETKKEVNDVVKGKKRFWCYLGVHYPELYSKAEERMRKGVVTGEDSQGRNFSTGILEVKCEVCGDVIRTEVWH